MDIWTIFMQNSQYAVACESLFFHKACSIAWNPSPKRKRSVFKQVKRRLGQRLKTNLSFLVILSFDRYLCVVYPIETMIYRTLKNAVIGCIISWIRFNIHLLRSGLSGQVQAHPDWWPWFQTSTRLYNESYIRLQYY